MSVNSLSLQSVNLTNSATLTLAPSSVASTASVNSTSPSGSTYTGLVNLASNVLLSRGNRIPHLLYAAIPISTHNAFVSLSELSLGNNTSGLFNKSSDILLGTLSI